ncbi:MAG TPA: response regulator [Herpetosiphonaceae bacterium]|nr:response regulator [Herpetosiphonaceae bacterium]
MDGIQDAHVAVIEDNPDNLELILSILQDIIGIKHCSSWMSGAAFFREVSHTRAFDLILLDIQIPRENGFDLIRRIRQDASLQSACVVAVTANTAQSDVRRAHEAGFNGFIGKPIRMDRFVNQITRIMAGETVWEPR